MLAAPAGAADRWVRAGTTLTKGDYYQGITSDGGGHLYFDGVAGGGYRTDLNLREQLRTVDLIPDGEPFDHIGDWTYDRNDGGRLILPLECFTAGAPNGGNTCGIGAFGVADPRTMTWRYRVRLDGCTWSEAWVPVATDPIYTITAGATTEVPDLTLHHGGNVSGRANMASEPCTLTSDRIPESPASSSRHARP